MVNSTEAFPANKLPEAKLLVDAKLMRAALLMLAMLATAFGGATWNVVQDLSIEVKAIPVVLFVVVCIIVAAMYVKTGQIARVSAGASAVQDEPAVLTQVEKQQEITAATQMRLQPALQDLRAGLELMSAVNVLEDLEKEEVERLLMNSLAAFHRYVYVSNSGTPRVGP